MARVAAMQLLASHAFRRAGLAAVGLSLLIPAGASADAFVSAGPVKVRDYQMTVSAFDGKTDSLSVMMRRADGKASQMHMFTFSTGINVTVAKNLGAATVKGSLGRYGAVNLKLRGPGALKSYGVPAGCTGKPSKGRAGTLAGAFKLVADTTYFKTVASKSLKAQVFKSGAIECGTDGSGNGGGGGATGGMSLSSFVTATDGGMTSLSVSKDAKGAVSQNVMRMEPAPATAPARIIRMISAPSAASTFTAAGDLSSASVTASSRFLTGAATFASENVFDTTAMGALSGSYAAKFDSIGTLAIAAGGPDATLRR